MNLRNVPIVTWSLVAACLSVFAGMVADGAGLLFVTPDLLIGAGAVEASRVWHGELWRLVSALFVHAAIWHVGMNMWVLWQVGRILERVQGSARFTLVYLVSGVFGFALSLIFHGGITAGASGAIFGVVGGLLALAAVTRETPFGRHLFRALGPFVAATLLIGFLLPFVDNAAHVGGLIAGFLLSYGLFADEKGARLDALRDDGLLHEDEVLEMKPRLAVPALAMMVLLFVVVVPTSLKPVYSPHYHVLMGFHDVRNHKFEDARAHAAEAERLAADDAGVLLLAGRLQQVAGDDAAARAFFRQALELYDADDPEAAQVIALGDIGLYDLDHAVKSDGVLTAGLCDALLEADGESKEQTRGPLLLNNCAWIYLKAEVPAAHDPVRGLRLAQRAVELAERQGMEGGELAAFLHTLAEGLSQGKQPAEARALMERIAAEGLSSDPFFEQERSRFDSLARKAAAGPP